MHKVQNLHWLILRTQHDNTCVIRLWRHNQPLSNMLHNMLCVKFIFCIESHLWIWKYFKFIRNKSSCLINYEYTNPISPYKIAAVDMLLRNWNNIKKNQILFKENNTKLLINSCKLRTAIFFYRIYFQIFWKTYSSNYSRLSYKLTNRVQSLTRQNPVSFNFFHNITNT